MEQIKYVSLMLILVFLATGCAGNYGIFKRKTGSDVKATKEQLIQNWSDYDILLNYRTGHNLPRLIALIFDAKNNDKKILIQESRRSVKVKDQEMWAAIVKEHTTSDGEFVLRWGPRQDPRQTGVQEIWGPDNQLYGYIIYQQDAVSLQRVEQIDENTIRISWSPPRGEGAGR